MYGILLVFLFISFGYFFDLWESVETTGKKFTFVPPSKMDSVNLDWNRTPFIQMAVREGACLDGEEPLFVKTYLGADQGCYYNNETIAKATFERIMADCMDSYDAADWGKIRCVPCDERNTTIPAKSITVFNGVSYCGVRGGPSFL